MRDLTGFYIKITAGIAFVLLIAMSTFSFANDTAVAANAQAVSTAASSGAPGSQNSELQGAVSAAPIVPAPQVVSPNKSSAAQTSSASQLASLVGGLLLILALIYGLSWFVKRFSQGGFLNNPTIKIVSAMPLGTRERLMLIDVGGKQLLLGVTAAQINTLHVFDEPVVQTENSQPATSDFSQKLMGILQQKNLVPAADAAQKNRT